MAVEGRVLRPASLPSLRRLSGYRTAEVPATEVYPPRHLGQTKMKPALMKPPPFIHEKALCEGEVGAGTRVWAFAHVMEGARVGEDCNLCDHCFVENGAVVGNRVTVKNGVLLWDKVTIGDEVFLGPNVVFTNDLNPRAAFKKKPADFLPTTVGQGATLGANATIVCGVTLGEQCFVGAGSVVVDDVPAHALVVGNPARRIGWVCTCGLKLKKSLACGCGRKFRPGGAGVGLRPRK
jgi:acetyltransferase-like isoleucine patch superfamily enzyme